MNTSQFHLQKQQPSQTVMQMVKMGLLCLLLFTLLGYMLIQKNKKRSTQKDRQKYREQPIFQSKPIPSKLNSSFNGFVSHKRFTFNQNQFHSDEEDYLNYNGQIEQINKNPKLTYSIQKSKQSFLKNLKIYEPQSLIYYDKQELKERQNRKKQLTKKQKEESQILIKPPSPKNKEKLKEGGQNIKRDSKNQEIKKTAQKKSIGEKTIFAPKQQKKKADFSNIHSLNNKKTEKNEEQKNKGNNNLANNNFQNSVNNENKNLLQNNNQQPKKVTQPIKSSQPTQKIQSKSLFQKSNLKNNQKLSKDQNFSFSSNPSVPQKTQKNPNQIQKQNQAIKQNLPQQIKQINPKNAQSIFSSPTGSLNAPSSQNARPVNAPSNQSGQMTFDKKEYLEKIIQFGTKAKKSCELKKTKQNNFGRSISNFKELYDTALDFLNTINVGDPKQVQTFACVIFQFLFYKTIPVWNQQNGWQRFPARGQGITFYKISINTYVLKLNIYRAMGYEKIWLTVFGKLLKLLQFTWKRQTQIKGFKELDFVVNGYFNLKNQKDMAAKYFTRLDLIIYFLFCMTTFDPQLVAQYICQNGRQDQKAYEQIKKLKYKWNYNYFWVLVQTILSNKTKTYFYPILTMNIISSMFLQIRRNKLNPTQFSDFDYLKKYLLKHSIQCTKQSALEANKQVSDLAKIQESFEGCMFDGQDFYDQIQTLNFYFKEKQDQYRKGIEEIQKRCSVFQYFKEQSGGLK